MYVFNVKCLLVITNTTNDAKQLTCTTLNVFQFQSNVLMSFFILDMRKEVAEMIVDERRVSVDTEDEESSSISPVKSSMHIKESSPFIYPSSAITDVSLCYFVNYN